MSWQRLAGSHRTILTEPLSALVFKIVTDKHVGKLFMCESIPVPSIRQLYFEFGKTSSSALAGYSDI